MNRNVQVLLLAAGEGKRLKPLTEKKPKTLLYVYKEYTILDIILMNFLDIGFKDFVFVIGYQGNKIKRYIELNYMSKMNDCIFVENIEYANTNNSYSLYLGLKYVRGNFILIDSDMRVLFLQLHSYFSV